MRSIRAPASPYWANSARAAARISARPMRGLSDCLGGQNPDSCRASEPAPDEIAQIEPCGAAGQPRVILDGAAVAQFEAATASAGDLGDHSFHVGPVLAVPLP